MAKRGFPDLSAYRKVIDHVIGLFEAYAELTGETWDDNIAAVVRSIFDKMFPGFGAGAPDTSAGVGALAAAADPLSVLSEDEQRNLPAWVIPLLIQFGPIIMKLVMKWLQR